MPLRSIYYQTFIYPFVTNLVAGFRFCYRRFPVHRSFVLWSANQNNRFFPLSQSLYWRPPADQKASGLWVRDWAFVGIVSSIPIWRSISLTKCLNWLSGYGSMKMKSMFSFSLHDRNVLDEVWSPNIKPLSWLWNLYPMSLLLNSKIYAHLAKYFKFYDADNNLTVKLIFFFL